MAFKKGQNPHHPRKGASIKVDPIRDLNAIERIKQNLIAKDNLRDHCLFTLGINTGWRAGELLSIKVGQVKYLEEGGLLTLKQSKTDKYRSTPVNRTALKAIQFWLAVYGSSVTDYAPLFPSRHAGALQVPTLCSMVKRWCAQAGLQGHFGSHTLRKTWGYHQRITYDASPALLMKAFGHSSERQTLEYLGIVPREIRDLFLNEL